MLQAGVGAETLMGAAASGPDVFIAGLGNDFITLGTGADTVTFVAGHTGNAVYSVQGFAPGDALHLQGYAGSAATDALGGQVSDGAGGTILTVVGGARIDLLHVSQATSATFK